MSWYAVSPRHTQELRLYRLICLGTLSVLDIPRSYDYTDLYVLVRCQSSTYPGVTTVQTYMSWYAVSPRHTQELRLYRLICLGTLSVLDIPRSYDYTDLYVLVRCQSSTYPGVTTIQTYMSWYAVSPRHTQELRLYRLICLGTLSVLDIPRSYDYTDLYVLVRCQSSTYPGVTTIQTYMSWYAVSPRHTQELRLYRLICLGTLSVLDIPRSYDCTDLYVLVRCQSSTYPGVTTIQTYMSWYAVSPRHTQELRLYRLICLGTLSVLDIPRSYDCTDLYVLVRCQSSTYPGVTTIQTYMSWYAVSPRHTQELRLYRLICLGTLSVLDIPRSYDYTDLYVLVRCQSSTYPGVTTVQTYMSWYAVSPRHTQELRLYRLICLGTLSVLDIPRSYDYTDLYVLVRCQSSTYPGVTTIQTYMSWYAVSPRHTQELRLYRLICLGTLSVLDIPRSYDYTDLYVLVRCQSSTYPGVTTIQTYMSWYAVSPRHTQELRLYRLICLGTLSVLDIPRSYDYTDLYVLVRCQSSTYPGVTTIQTYMSWYAVSPRHTQELRLYRLICLGTLSVLDIPRSYDYTDLYVLVRCQSSTYPGVTTIQTDMSWYAVSL
ncbi:hypothetical protein DPMN_092890 [Dreissena polymorpha]|uniref:Uncharacterized protein n=1 Tax=Dreissena polymorpha TaxID=45954 RepID=A0A9D4L369_DREPO|nr:hypothetical protein DPMN_092890 [Dreissena polymorpha]